MATDSQPYPRPDFERSALRWLSLNGPWDFLFDDTDVGLSQLWQHTGLPQDCPASSSVGFQGSSEGQTITQKIAAGTQELLKDNIFSPSEDARTNKKRQIIVPFVFQSPASGINDRGVHEVLWYERTIADPRGPDEIKKGHRLLVRFGAVDYEAKVWVNGRYVGGHRGGHVPFELDITDELDPSASANAATGSHRLTLRVYDSAYDLTQPRGKQYWAAQPESIFYTPSGGIWQNVWLEVVPPVRIADSSRGTVIRSNDIGSGLLHNTIGVVGRRAGRKCAIEVEAAFAGVVVSKSSPAEFSKETDFVTLDLDLRLSEEQRKQLPADVLSSTPLGNDDFWRDGVALWSPEHPSLYDLAIRLIDPTSGDVLDEVKTTTGMRSIDWSNPDGVWRLNGKPYFQALCLDQGYWPDTFMTPPTADSLKEDIQLAKRMGLNGCRKHQKVEDPAFYYWADKLGYLVWAEMANSYQFSSEYVERFDQEWIESVKLAINRPSVVTWTPVNESWGYPSLKDDVDQRNHIRSLYYATKTLDPTRSINDNCGWEHVLTDLSTFHDYADGPELEKTCASLDAILGLKAGRDLFVAPVAGDPGTAHRPGAPIMCTEFGGVNIVPASQDTRDWGYTTASDPEDLLERIDKLVKGVVAGGHCCAFVYTQLTDIEQETNGLYNFNRVEKLDAKRVKILIDEALEIFYNRVRGA